MDPQNAAQVVCHGAPPTPVVLGAQHDTLGRMQFQIKTMYPIVYRVNRACAVHKAKSSMVV